VALEQRLQGVAVAGARRLDQRLVGPGLDVVERTERLSP
jgi:hypothetical protein